MHIYKKIFFLPMVLYLLSCCLSAQAQFFTIRAKKEEKAEVIERIVEESQDSVKEAAVVIPVSNNSGLEEDTTLMLDGMRRRQFLSLPIDEIKVNSPYGYRNDPFTGKRKFHKGIDLDADFNYVYSVMPGRVVKSGKNRSLGEFVQVEHGEFITTYGHLMQRFVASKETVEAGQTIGISGSTGISTGEHLHFAMSYDGKSIDPEPILNYIFSIMTEARKELENAINQLSTH